MRVRRFVPDKFVFGVLDYLYAVGVWGFGVGVCGFSVGKSFGGELSRIPDLCTEN